MSETSSLPPKPPGPPQEIKREADKNLARSAWGLLWNQKAPLWATLGIIIVFTVRSTVCSYENDIPAGVDFEWYGEHCGPGHGDPDSEAMDELDAACKRHDEAYNRAQAES
jgi:hypothetical protein